ncbi:uncharacterized protein TNIN_206721 [Trichonephila inaurata madagascariensis]|uniref:Uncharacterized protein n=1 Tax=Trichonephila inaurata madagascariensis TaxID=2747483 RepID=A0A8X6ISG0_9ARAC|nr:uncharacterized protein TNIN_461021 [Trichonephila inaurata madagascariensis]GFY37965.1 uncharacterized protein TNIN_206721 [Trichonephila inaurata madagascariensis]
MAEDSDMDEDNMSGMEDDPNDSDYEQQKLTFKAKKVKRGNNGKWKLYYENRIFKKEWLDLFPWVEEDPDDSKFAICRACNRKIKAHKGILETHQKTKKHLKNLSGSDDIEDEEETRKPERQSEPKVFNIPNQPTMEQILSDDQFSFFTESPIDAAHQAITNLIDKLVEKYHENRLENLKVENQAIMQLNVERANLIRSENQRKLERREMQETNNREALAVQLKFMQQQHETKINCMERERDAKLKAVEQQLMFARQEYERKVKLLDQQLQSMK